MFPDLNIGVVVARNIDNKDTNPEITNLVKILTEIIRTDFQLDNLAERPEIKVWRDAYASFGAKPKKYQCSIENLCRSLLSGMDLRSINKIVDIYNCISLKHIIPAGGDDLDKVQGDIKLKISDGTEDFIQLNSDRVDRPKPGEIIYADNAGVLCRRWNWRECDRTKMTPSSRNVLLVIEGLPPFTRKNIQAITEELGAAIKKYCGGDIATSVLNRTNPSMEL